MKICEYDKVYKENGEIQKKVSDSIIEAVSFLKKNKIKKILDLGYGTGRNVSYLKNNDFDISGCDVSNEALRIAKKKCGRCSFHTMPNVLVIISRRCI